MGAEVPGLSVPEIWKIDQPLMTCRIGESSSLSGKTREEIFSGNPHGLTLLAIRDGDDIQVAPSRWTQFESGQELAVLGPKEGFEQFTREKGCIPDGEAGSLAEMLTGGGYGFAELVVRPRASIIGKTPREIMFRKTFGIEPIVHVRGRDRDPG
ncbi:MAG: hypothetical protein NQU46_05460 [Methanolinea sp.]|nr:hypothetical protein [Methanolinea sp.]